MGFRFRRSFRLAKGIRVNLSRSGSSLSIGPRGATVNFGRRGTKMTVGVPGTGLSYSTMLDSGPPTALPRGAARRQAMWPIALALIGLAAIMGAFVLT